MSDLYRKMLKADMTTEQKRDRRTHLTGDMSTCFVPVEPCVHGNYARHPIEDMFTVSTGFGGDVTYRHEFCDGKPEGDSDE